MARLDFKRFKESKIRGNKAHEIVAGQLSVIILDNEKLIQIDTYGSDNRQITGKVSQSIQFDEATLKHLLEIYKKEFKKVGV